VTLVRRQGRGSWPDEYRRLYRPTFVEVKGRVFALGTRSRSTIKQFKRQFREPPTVVDENTLNHEHFWYFDNTTIEGCRKNYVLAEAVRLAWSELLGQLFPDRNFELFVCNEYAISEDFDAPGTIVHEEVTPTLRLWTGGDTESQSMREAYHIDDLGPEKVLWPERIEEGLFDLEEIYALIESGPEHPSKIEALEVRRTWTETEQGQRSNEEPGIAGRNAEPSAHQTEAGKSGHLTCIYCRRSLPKSAFTKVEHVMPRSFGTFKHSFTLRDSVCDECNQYFGDNLEIELARDTYEGITRFKHKVKKPVEFPGSKKGGRTTIRVADGIYKGALAYLEYSAEKNDVIALPVPQVGFKSGTSGSLEFISVDEILGDVSSSREKFKRADRLLFLGCDRDEIVARLRSNGIEVKLDQDDVAPEVTEDGLLCEVVSQVDPVIRRAVAKIALNYLTHFEGAEYVLQPDFDATRRFVRYGDDPGYPVVQIVERAILADEPLEGYRRDGHLITIGTASDGRSVCGQVSLFNQATYAVSLARDYAGERQPAKRGHFFNIADRRILELSTKLAG
jgi:hypothetical protein